MRCREQPLNLPEEAMAKAKESAGWCIRLGRVSRYGVRSAPDTCHTYDTAADEKRASGGLFLKPRPVEAVG